MKNLAYKAAGSNMFINNVGLITSNGPIGPNIMAAEWTHHISYEPPLVMINIEPDDATVENIIASKEFGINLANDEQNVLSSVSGKYSGKNVDKISLLKELGFEFYDGEKINVPMVKGAALSAEFKLIKYETMGDHIIFIGQVVKSSVDEPGKPIIYRAGKYWKVGENIPKPGPEFLEKINKLAEKYKKN